MAEFYSELSKERAIELLNDFNKNAYNTSLFNVYKRVVEIIYGPGFDVVYNRQKRMEFFCYICRKLMNGLRSLEQHSESFLHRKNKSGQEKIQTEDNFDSESSFEKLIRYTHVPVLGLQYIEIYEYSDDYQCSAYYKCNLCGDHGDKCYMYYHVIGDNHTDMYINLKIKMENNQSLNYYRRLYLRKEIRKMETYGAHSIITYVGRTLYPYIWQYDSQKREKHLARNTTDDDDGKMCSYKLISENNKVMERDRSKFSSYTFFRHFILENILKIVYVDMQQLSVECYDYQRPILKITAYIHHVLYLVTERLTNKKRKRDHDTKDLVKQKKRIKKSLSIINYHLISGLEQSHAESKATN